MRRISAANTAPGNQFRDANPGAGQKATSLNARWCNDVQESIMAVIEARGGGESAAYDALYRAMVDIAHPVTSYLFLEREDSPSVDWPWTTWTEVKGRVLVGFDDEQTEFNLVGKEDGAKAVELAANQMPAHRHRMFGNADGGAALNASPDSTPSFKKTSGTNSEYSMEGTGGDATLGLTGAQGSGEAHNNLQPYRVSRMWRRTE